MNLKPAPSAKQSAKHVHNTNNTDADEASKAMEPQNRSNNDFLLQIPQAASGSAIQIPADILASLLQSFTGVQNNVLELKTENREFRQALNNLQSFAATLQKENEGLQQELSIMEKNVLRLQIESGMEFALFPKLPLEVRRMIWVQFANIPRVVAVKRVGRLYKSRWGDGFDLPLVPAHYCAPQLRICKEARRECSKTMMSLVMDPDWSGLTTSVKIFLNPWTDTLWLKTLDEGSLDDGDRCEITTLAELYLLENCPDNFLGAIVKLVLPYLWFRKELRERPEDFIDFAMEILCECETEELILVVGGESVCGEPDITFVKPRQSPSETLCSDVLEDADNKWGSPLTWEMIEAADMKDYESFQARRAAERKEYRQSSLAKAAQL